MPDVFETYLQFRCEADLHERLRKVAAIRHRKLSPMVREWLWDRVEAEEKAAGILPPPEFRYPLPTATGSQLNSAPPTASIHGKPLKPKTLQRKAKARHGS